MIALHVLKLPQLYGQDNCTQQAESNIRKIPGARMNGKANFQGATDRMATDSTVYPFSLSFSG